jgi:hypothetical protein
MVRGIEVEVEYTYYRGYPGTLETPPEPEMWEVEAILISGEDMTKYLTPAFQEYTWEKLQEVMKDGQ